MHKCPPCTHYIVGPPKTIENEHISSPSQDYFFMQVRYDKIFLISHPPKTKSFPGILGPCNSCLSPVEIKVVFNHTMRFYTADWYWYIDI